MNPSRSRRLLLAPVVVDAGRIAAAPGAILLEGRRIIAAGSPQEVGRPSDAIVEQLEGEAILPALVNAHAHLDLSSVGPRPWCGSFTGWVDMVRHHRVADASAIASAVDHGVSFVLAGGCAAVGDIAGVGSLIPLERLRDSPLTGVSYIEFFGIGSRQETTVRRMSELVHALVLHERGVAVGLQPHAPYSCGEAVYAGAAELACELDLPLSTHLAETREELEFMDLGTGSFVELLRQIGVWEPGVGGCGAHPVEVLCSALKAAPFLAAHLNYVGPAQLDLLAGTPVTVAYCPRASAYFGHGDHPYRAMMERGIPVALGTDSIICLDTPDRMSTLDDMRLLFRRDAFDPRTALAMATVNGARALRLDERQFTFEPGEPAGVIAVPLTDRRDGGGGVSRAPGSVAEGLRLVMSNSRPPRWIVEPGKPADGRPKADRHARPASTGATAGE